MTTSEPVHLAVDLGASSGRVMAGSVVDGKLVLDEVHRFANDPVRVHGSMLWDVLGLWQDIKDGLRIAKNKYPQVASVGVDSWGVDYVLVDSHDQIAGCPHNYRDARTRGMIDRTFEIVSREKIFQETGLQFLEINTLYQLVSQVQSRDPSLSIADGFLMMGDFFHWLLTGRRSIEVTNASTTQLLDPRTKTWSENLILKLGLPRNIFIDCFEPGNALGNVQDSVAKETGLSDVPVIVPATHDTASAVIAVPASEFAPEKPNWCYISSGTWSLMGCELPEPKINEKCSEMNFTNEGGVLGSTRLLQNIGGLWIFQQIRKSLERRGQAESWEEMVKAATQADPFALLIDPDAADFVAPDDMVEAITSFAGRTGQSAPTSKASLYRTALEGLALRYRVCLGMLETLVEHRIDVIHIVGGGSQNHLLCQMTADACNRTVVAGPVEATASGNLVMQLLGTGKLASIQEGRQLVRDSFDTVEFSPQNAEAWNGPAEAFAKL